MLLSRTNNTPSIQVRSSRPEVFCKKSVLRSFAKFTGKHLCQSLNKHFPSEWFLIFDLFLSNIISLRKLNGSFHQTTHPLRLTSTRLKCLDFVIHLAFTL